jgi:hypothetical protein
MQRYETGATGCLLATNVSLITQEAHLARYGDNEPLQFRQQ